MYIIIDHVEGVFSLCGNLIEAETILNMWIEHGIELEYISIYKGNELKTTTKAITTHKIIDRGN